MSERTTVSRSSSSGPPRDIERAAPTRPPPPREAVPAAVHAVTDAPSAFLGPSHPLPFLAPIQRAFGRHDVGAIRAHTGADAATAARALDAAAFATGNHVAFAGPPDLHTAAHEAAHVVQQRAGVHLKGSLDEPGDAYERHADAVADLVVAGRSAEAELSAMAPAGGGGRAAVQRKPTAIKDLQITGKTTLDAATHATQPVKQDKAQPAISLPGAGTGGELINKPGTVWTTEIDFGATNKDHDGTLMEAKKLGPDHKLGAQPDHQASPVWEDRVNALDAIFEDEHIAGHLLNHQLGGPGNDSRNLTPITQSANKVHEIDVESHVKKLVNVEHAWVYYRVEVVHATIDHVTVLGQGKPGSKKYVPRVTEKVTYPKQLVCTWHQLDVNGNPINDTRAARTIQINHKAKKKTLGYFDTTTTVDNPVNVAGHPNTVPARSTTGPARHADTAYTPLAFDQVVLDEAEDVIIRAKAIRVLVDALGDAHVTPQFLRAPADVARDVATLLNENPSDSEKLATQALDAEIEACHKAKAPKDYVPKRDVITGALAMLKAERDKRIAMLGGKAELLYANKYDAGHAGAYKNEFTAGLGKLLTLLPKYEGFIDNLSKTVKVLQNQKEGYKLIRKGSVGQLGAALEERGGVTAGKSGDQIRKDLRKRVREDDEGTDTVDVLKSHTKKPTGNLQRIVDLVTNHREKIKTLDPLPYEAVYPDLKAYVFLYAAGLLKKSGFETALKGAYEAKPTETQEFLVMLDAAVKS